MIEKIIAECCLGGVCEWVVCAGARNVTVIEVLSRCIDLKKWHHFDERTAGFFALGRIQDMGLPIAVLTTSGTAAAELLPAVIEAYYAGRPLVVVTADRPAEYRGTGAPQAIEQAELFGVYAPTVDVRNCHSEEAEQLIEEAFTGWDYRSPLHLNLCLPEPEWKCGERELDFYPSAAPERGFAPMVVGDLARALRAERDVVLMIGGLDPTDQPAVEWLARELRVPVVADATSGLREELTDYLLVDADAELLASPPRVVLRLGDVPVARFWRDLEHLPPTQVQVFSVSRTGWSGLARESGVMMGGAEEFVQSLGDVQPIGDETSRVLRNKRHAARIEELILQLPEAAPAMVWAFSQAASGAGHVYLGNSLPVRYWNAFAQRIIPTPNVRANRGANGIDGQIATFLGNAAYLEDAWALVGDLTAFYDANAYAMLGQLEPARRVIGVLNNRGGGIFETMMRGAAVNKCFHDLVVQPHAWACAGLAQQWGWQHIVVSDADALGALYDLPKGHGSYLVELMPDAEQTKDFARLLHGK